MIECELPTLDNDIEMAFAENVADIIDGLENGTLVTASVMDLPVGHYSGQVIACKLDGRKDKEGQTTFPMVNFKVKTDEFTTQTGMIVDPREKSKFGLQKVITTFINLLGQEKFKSVKTPPPTATAEQIYEWVSNLADQVHAGEPMVTLSIKEYEDKKTGDKKINASLTKRAA